MIHIPRKRGATCGAPLLFAAILTTLLAAPVSGQSFDTTTATSNRGSGWVDTSMYPGRQNLSMYTPSSCLAAANGALRTAERAVLDSSGFFRTDTMPTVAVTMARTCLGRFSLASVPEKELLNFMQLALMANNDALAQAAVDRRVNLSSDPVQRGQTLLESDTAYMGARPTRKAAVVATMARLDSLGPVVALKQITAHDRFMQYARNSLDLPTYERELAIKWKLRAFVSAADKKFIEWQPACYADAGNLWGLHIVTGTLSPMDALTRVVQLQKDAGCPQPELLKTVMTTLQPGAFMLAHIGQPVTPPAGTYWFGPNGQHTWPVPGKVSLYVPTSEDDKAIGINLRRNEQVKRLKQRYGDQINITYATKTKGYFHDSPPLTPAQEAERLRKFFQDELQLPVSLVVEETPMQRLADGRYVMGKIASDGRIVKNQSDEGFYGLVGYSLLTDQTGKLIFWGLIGSPDAWVETMIDHALGKTTGQK